MLLRIPGAGEYDLTAALERPTLNDVFYMQVKTKSEEYPKGISLTWLGQQLRRLDEVPPAERLDDADLVMALRCMVFLARRKAGEKVTIDEANDFPLDAFDVEAEDGDEPPAEDPQVALPTSVPVDVVVPVGPTFPTTSSLTSAGTSA